MLFLLIFSFSVFAFFSVQEVVAAVDQEVIREQVLEAVEERKREQAEESRHPEPAMSAGRLDSGSKYEGIPDQVRNDRLAIEEIEPDVVKYEFFGGFVQVRRVSGQWYLSVN